MNDDDFPELPDMDAMLEFGSMLPDTEFNRQFALSPWHELRRQLFLFLIHVLPPDYNQLGVAEEPDEETEKRCDNWIRSFVEATNRKGMVPPADLRKWAAVRARRALIISEIDSVRDEEYKKPDVRGNFAHEIISRLVDQWHERGREEWLLNPGQTASDEVTTITWHLKEKGITLKPATTWSEVLKLSDETLKLVNLQDRYPVGKTASELEDALCQLWLRETILAPDGLKAAPDRTIAPWLAARLQTAKHVIKSYIRQGSSAPWPEGNASQALYVLVVPQWEEELSKTWLGFHYQKGKLNWDPSRVPGGNDFSRN